MPDKKLDNESLALQLEWLIERVETDGNLTEYGRVEIMKNIHSVIEYLDGGKYV